MGCHSVSPMLGSFASRRRVELLRRREVESSQHYPLNYLCKLLDAPVIALLPHRIKNRHNWPLHYCLDRIQSTCGAPGRRSPTRTPQRHQRASSHTFDTVCADNNAIHLVPGRADPAQLPLSLMCINIEQPSRRTAINNIPDTKTTMAVAIIHSPVLYHFRRRGRCRCKSKRRSADSMGQGHSDG